MNVNRHEADRRFPVIPECPFHSKSANKGHSANDQHHDEHRRMVEREGIPFHCIPVTSETKARAFEKIAALDSRDDCQKSATPPLSD